MRDRRRFTKDANTHSLSMEESLEDSRMDCSQSDKPEKPGEEIVRVKLRHRPAYRGVYLDSSQISVLML